MLKQICNLILCSFKKRKLTGSFPDDLRAMSRLWVPQIAGAHIHAAFRK
ncbi:MAG: hypothetical protein ACI9VS_000621 [Candidatus Binatia bacterium]|jgi:hypothetical protein